MKANEIPEKIYLFENPISDTFDDRWLSKRSDENDIEYTRTDTFIEKACEYWYQYNRDIVKKHGAKALLGCSEFTVNVEGFKKYLKGE